MLTNKNQLDITNRSFIKKKSLEKENKELIIESMNREKKIIRTSIIGIATNLLLVAGKATIGIIAHSISIISDAINNLSDVLSSVVTIVGTKLANKKPDRDHPYGHGRIEYVT